MPEMDHENKDGTVAWWRLIIQLNLIIVATSLLLSRPSLIKAIRNEQFTAEWLHVGRTIFLVLFLLHQFVEFLARKTESLVAIDYIQIAFGLLVIALSFPSSLREYKTRRLPDPENISLVEKFATSKDGSIRALAMLAASRYGFNNPSVGALIHAGLLDKDPLVQQAAKLVIEDNFGIRLGNDAEGIHQAQTFIQDVSSSASLLRKGSP
jgi:hypothetical protein